MIRILLEVDVDEKDLCDIAQNSDMINELNEDIKQFCEDYIEDIWENYCSVEVKEAKKL